MMAVRRFDEHGLIGYLLGEESQLRSKSRKSGQKSKVVASLVSKTNVPFARQRVRCPTPQTNADAARSFLSKTNAAGLMNAPKVSDCIYEKQSGYTAFCLTTLCPPRVRSESATLSFCTLSG